jgi:hypothetical protein
VGRLEEEMTHPREASFCIVLLMGYIKRSRKTDWGSCITNRGLLLLFAFQLSFDDPVLISPPQSEGSGRPQRPFVIYTLIRNKYGAVLDAI